MKNRMKTSRLLMSVLLSGVMLGGVAHGQEKKVDVAKKAEASKETSNEIKLSGVLEGEGMSRVKVELTEWGFSKKWKGQKVLLVKGHGDTVKRGDVLIQFDTKDIDLDILKRKREIEKKEFSLEKAGLNLRVRKITAAMDLANAERRYERAKERLDHYLKVDKAYSVKDIKRSLDGSEFSYQYEKAELDQLLQMYKADDLTDVTEEMILKRQRRSVDRAEYGFEKAKIRTERQLRMDVPETDRSKRESLEREALKLAQTQLNIKSELSGLEADYENQVASFEKAVHWFEIMKSDREQLTKFADRDGVVYYGDVRGGKFSKESHKNTLKVGGYGVADQVLMTVVSDGDFVIHLDLDEKQKNKIKVGMTGVATHKAYDNEEMKVEVLSVDNMYKTPGKFDAVFKVSAVKGGDFRVGMKCDIKFDLK